MKSIMEEPKAKASLTCQWQPDPLDHQGVIRHAVIVIVGSLRDQNIVMIVANVFLDLIIIVFGWEHASVKGTIAGSGGIFLKRQYWASGLLSCTLNLSLKVIQEDCMLL
jgi:hypothetical protein